LIVGLAAGGSLDSQARAVARRLAEITGTQVIVENKPGASMMLSASDVMRAQPDGYTLLYAPSSLFAQNPHTLSSVPYDPFKDFTPITMAARGPLVLTVHQSLPVQSAKDLVAWAKANPGKLNFASSGNGSSIHLSGELFKAMTGTDIVHVPYKGSPQAINDLMAGNIQVMFDNVPSIGPHVKAGRVRGLGVSAPKRAAQFPDIPTIAEAVPGYETNSWGGVIGPAKLPKEIVSRLTAEIRKALGAPAVAERYRQLDTEPDGAGPEAFLELVRKETPKWADVVKKSGAKVD
jgi:tripartite-type tricarboxylate transporter receptor subunit TctC